MYEEEDLCPTRTSSPTYIYILWAGAGVAAISLLALLIYDFMMKQDRKLIYFAGKSHLILSYVHLICIILDWGLMKDVMIDVIYFVSTATVAWTLLVACLSFSRLYIIKKEEIYNKFGLCLFVFVATTIVRTYEEIIILILYTIEIFQYMDKHCGYYPIKLAFRLSSTLLLLTAPFVLLAVVIRSLCTRSNLSWKYYVLFTFHVFLFVASDAVLICYEYAMYLPEDFYKDLITVLVPVRWMIELTWIWFSNKYLWTMLYTE